MPTRANPATLLEAPWALLPATLTRIIDAVRAGGPVALKLEALEGAAEPVPRVGGVAVIPVHGVIEYRSSWLMEWFGGCSVEGLREDLAAALGDPTVTAIVLDVDSPGGSVSGITELAAELRGARGGAKPIVAVANTLAASAAYWLASQADELVVTPSGHVGSIGVYAIHEDVSRMLDEMGVTVTLIAAGEHKTEGNEFEPLTDEARKDIQDRVDGTYQQFVADVAAGRRVSADQVAESYGGGRVLSAKKALATGMVDRVETIGQTVARMGRPAARRRAMAAEAEPPTVAGERQAEELATALRGQVLTLEDAADAIEHATFSERLAALAAEAQEIVAHATERARLRAKEGRPAFSATTQTTLRSIRGAFDSLLLALDEPAPTDQPDEPAPSAPPPAADPVLPVVAANPKRFQTDEDWLRFLAN